MSYSNFRLMPMIPLFKGGVSNRTDRISTASVFWNSEKGIVAQSSKVGYQDYVKWLKGQFDKTIPWVMLDANREKFGPNYPLIKDSRIRGRERWFDPGIRSIDDVFDAFSMDTDMLLINSMGLESLELLKDAHEVSDSCIPLLMYNGKSIIFNSGLYDVRKALEGIDAIGFENVVVLNLLALGKKNKAGDPFWKDIYRGKANLIPAGGITEKDLPYLNDWNYDEAIRDYVSPLLQVMEKDFLPDPVPLENKHRLKYPIPHLALDCDLP